MLNQVSFMKQGRNNQTYS